jgi:hypothetical protein
MHGVALQHADSARATRCSLDTLPRLLFQIGDSMKSVAIGALLATLALAASAQGQDTRPVRALVGMGLTFGGDKLATVGFTDGSSESIRSGGLFTLYAGAEFRASDVLAIQATFGYHADSTSAASNGSLRFSRYPLDLLALYSVNDKVRLGGGVEFVNNPKVAGSGDLRNVNVGFKNSTGLVLEGEYLFTPRFGAKARVAAHEFESKATGEKVDGNYFGLMLNYYF